MFLLPPEAEAEEETEHLCIIILSLCSLFIIVFNLFHFLYFLIFIYLLYMYDLFIIIDLPCVYILLSKSTSRQKYLCCWDMA